MFVPVLLTMNTICQCPFTDYIGILFADSEYLFCAEEEHVLTEMSQAWNVIRVTQIACDRGQRQRVEARQTKTFRHKQL